MNEEYTVKTEIFEGPLELLLNLVEKRKFFINDISLAVIADDYIGFIKNKGGISIKESSDFILIASALILIKSKSLLPNLNLTLEEEQNIDDLEKRLKIYKRIRNLSVYVNERFGKQIIFGKNYKQNIEPIFSPDKNITPQNVFTSIVNVVIKIPKKEITPKKSVRKSISLEEMIDNLTERIRKNIKMSFRDFSEMDKKDKIYVVISFLAMLELVKQGAVSVQQVTIFGEIDIENRDIGIPSY